MEIELKVFTLNCWGLPVVSKNRKPRMQAIAEFLATNQFDVVCLQEVWSNSDYNLICEKVSGVFPYSHYFHSGVTGSGICILSKYKLQDVFFHQWPVNGYVHKLQHGDWFGGKGVGLCRLKINDYNVNVYSAHLHAEYNRNCDEYQAHRILQAFDTAQFIQLTSGGADIVVLAGDLNTEPGDLAYRILINAAGLVDSYLEADDIAQLSISTNEGYKNSYTPNNLIKAEFIGKRIDYIMYSSGSNVDVQMKKYYLPLPERVPNFSYSYSDHEAVAAIFSINRSEIGKKILNKEPQKIVFEECINVCQEAIKRIHFHKTMYLLFTFILFVLLIVTVVLKSPFDYPVVFHILRILLTTVMCFTLIMGTLWNKIESNAIFASKLAMEVKLRHLIQNETF